MGLAEMQQAVKDATARADHYPAEVQPFLHAFLTEGALLGQVNRSYTGEWRYPTYQELLMDLGAVRQQDYYVPDDPLFLEAEAQQCFYNAYQAIVDRPGKYTYVEGKATAGHLIVNHAWLEDREGRIVDPTWGNHVEAHGTPTYFGIRFSDDFVFRRALETGWVSILNREHEYKPDFPALRFGFQMHDGFATDYARSE